MRILTLSIIVLVLTCCSTNNSESGKNLAVKVDSNNVTVTNTDSVEIWVNTAYLETVKENISICDCWRKNKYHLFYYDTVNMQLYLKSNLIHYGHDSEIILPIFRTDSGFRYDSTLNDWPIEIKEFEIPSNDTLTLLDGNDYHSFIKMYLPIVKDSNSLNNPYFFYSDFRDFFYQLNSNLLLKYTDFDENRSSSLLIDPDTLNKFIRKGKVSGHCSDDYYFDGITIKNDSNRYFQLQFKKRELWMYEHSGRDRYKKLYLDTLPRQIMLLESKN